MQTSSFPAMAHADHARHALSVSVHQRVLRVLSGDARASLFALPASCEEW
ncbi:hypothetical protein [Polaromonas sp. LjRoot131]